MVGRAVAGVGGGRRGGRRMGTADGTLQRRVTWLTYGAVLLVGLNNGWLGPFLPQIARTQGIAIESAGLLLSALYAGFLLAVLVAGGLVERWGGRVALSGALALLAAGLAGLAGLPGLPAILASAAVAGLGHGLLDVAGHVLIADLHPDDRGRLTAALNYLNVAFGVGAFLGPVLAGFALRGGFPYRGVFSLGAAAAVLVGAALAFTPLRHRRATAGTVERTGGVLAHPIVWALGGVLLLYIGVEAGLGAWLATYLRAAGGRTEAAAAWTVSLFWIGLIGGRLLAGRLAGRLATGPLTAGGVALAALALATLAFAPAQPALQAAAVTLIGVGLGPVFPNAIAIGAARFPRQVGPLTAAVIAIGSVGGIVGPWALGRTLVAAGPRAAMGLALGATVLLLGLLWLAGRLSGAPAPRATPQAQPGTGVR